MIEFHTQTYTHSYLVLSFFPPFPFPFTWKHLSHALSKNNF